MSTSNPNAIGDGFGNEWDAVCETCNESVEIVHPGKTQCGCDNLAYLQGLTEEQLQQDIDNARWSLHGLQDEQLCRYLKGTEQTSPIGTPLQKRIHDLGVELGNLVREQERLDNEERVKHLLPDMERLRGIYEDIGGREETGDKTLYWLPNGIRFEAKRLYIDADEDYPPMFKEEDYHAELTVYSSEDEERKFNFLLKTTNPDLMYPLLELFARITRDIPPR